MFLDAQCLLASSSNLDLTGSEVSFGGEELNVRMYTISLLLEGEWFYICIEET